MHSTSIQHYSFAAAGAGGNSLRRRTATHLGNASHHFACYGRDEKSANLACEVTEHCSVANDVESLHTGNHYRYLHSAPSGLAPVPAVVVQIPRPYQVSAFTPLPQLKSPP
eukprot:scpid107174/ scgid35774/ 